MRRIRTIYDWWLGNIAGIGGGAYRGAGRWLLRDEFTDTRAAGSVNGTSAVPGPGTRTVVDTGNRLSVGSDVCSITTGGGAGDPAIWYGAIANVAGRFMLTKITPSEGTSKLYDIGWDSAQTGVPYHFLRFNGTSFSEADAGVAGAIVGATTASDTYYICNILRGNGLGHYILIKGAAFTTWTLLWNSSNTGALANGYPEVNMRGAGTIDFLRVPSALWLPTPSAYDTFTRSNGALGNTETAGPDGQAVTARAWTGATWSISSNTAINTPTPGAEDVANGNMEAGDPPTSWTGSGATLASVADERTGGAGSKSMSVTNDGAAVGSAYQTLDNGDGTWVRMELYPKKVTGNTKWELVQSDGTTAITSTGSTLTSWALRVATGRLVGASCRVKLYCNSTTAGHEARYDDVSVKPLTLFELMSSISVGSANVLASVAVTGSGTYQGQLGMVLRLDSASIPANFLLALVDMAANKVELIQCLAGSYSVLITGTLTYAAGATLRVILDGTSGELYYNGARVGTGTSSIDAGITGTLHGMFNTLPDSGNSLDNFSVFPRGSGGEYDVLNNYIK